jgi:uncharacterized protein (TIGR02145 family)
MIKLIKIVLFTIGLLTLLVIAFNCKQDKASEVPTLTTVAITNVTETALTTGGVITSDGGANISMRGVCWSTKPNPTLVYLDSTTNNGSGSGVFASAVKGLKPAATYYIRAYATNSAGTGYGNELTSNYSVVPVLSTNVIIAVTDSIVTCGGTIASDGGKAVKSRGVCWSTSKNPTTANFYTTDGKGIGGYNSTITNLSPDITYYVRAYAINDIGTAYGNERSFSTSKLVVKDKDNNYYRIVTIGSQVWMADNLKTTRFRDSTLIPLVGDNTTWSQLPTPGYCWYNNQSDYGNTYGALYNWPAVSSQKLCPTGWHVPTDTEWISLENQLGGLSVAGGKLKEIGTEHWTVPNSGATNEMMFNGLPGGYRINTGEYDNKGSYGNFWSATSVNATVAYYRYLYYGNGIMTKSFVNQKYGLSVRCLKN